MSVRNTGLRVSLAMFVAAAACHSRPVSPPIWATVRAEPGHSIVVGQAHSSRRGQSVAGAVVRLIAADGRTADTTWVDVEGAFLLAPIAPGSYRIEVRSIGHRPFATTRELRAGMVDTVIASLRYDESQMMSDCIGQRPDETQGFGQQFCRP